jgi:predicted ATPase
MLRRRLRRPESRRKFFISRITGKGVYLIDEPEAALSPQGQLSLIYLIMSKPKDVDAQFIVATHSSIIIAITDVEILEFRDGQTSPTKYEDTEHYKITKSFLEDPKAFLKAL